MPRQPEAKRRPRIKLNTLPEALPEVDGTAWGPAMQALPSDKHRAFVLNLYLVKPGHGAAVKAAKAAGFGSKTSSPHSWAVIASRLSHDERILAALREEDENRIRSSAPRAIRGLSALIENPDHRDHARAIGMVLDRVHPVEFVNHHHVSVTDNRRPDPTEIAATIERVMKLAATFGLAGKLPVVVEHQPSEAAA